MIKFGTSGWRGLIARDFTFDQVRLATQGIADYLKAELANRESEIHGRAPVVILGHDTRFLGREFSLAAAEVLDANNLISFRWTGDAKIIGVGNGDPSSHEPDKYVDDSAWQRRLFNGKAQVILQAGKTESIIKLENLRRDIFNTYRRGSLTDFQFDFLDKRLINYINKISNL